MNHIKKAEGNKTGLPVGTEQEFRWLALIVAFIIVLNILDAVFTLFWVNAGVAKEANVLLRDLVHNYPILFVLAKFGLVFAGTFVLWKYRFERTAVLGMFIVFLIYYALLLHHLSYSSRLIFKYIFG